MSHGAPIRLVSLVPSLTETCCDLGLRSMHIVGRTPFCVHPEAEVALIPVVGGTKTPSLRRILAAAPSLVLLDREENRRETFEALRAAGLSLFVSEVRSPLDVPALLRSLGEAIGCRERAQSLAAALDADLLGSSHRIQKSLRALPLIWHEPLMAVQKSRYAGALLEAAGFVLPDLGRDPYPVVGVSDILQAEVDVLLLSSEPHEFTEAEGEALRAKIAAEGGKAPRIQLIDGEALTWFGSRTHSALGYFRKLRETLSFAIEADP